MVYLSNYQLVPR